MSCKKFSLFSLWEIEDKGPFFEVSKRPKYLIDLSTQDKYWNEKISILRVKFLLLVIVGPFAHGIATLLTILLRTLQLLFFFLPSMRSLIIKNYFAILLSPLTYVGLEIAALYGLISPYNGRKCYAFLERWQYHHFRLAPSFQPIFTEVLS